MKTESPFDPWLSGRHKLPKRFIDKTVIDEYDPESWSCWVALKNKAPLHDAHKLEWFSLGESHNQTKRFLSAADKILYPRLEEEELDSENRYEIKNSGIVPPATCHPIYIVTCKSEHIERVMYVGKTTAANRFTGGHAAATKLLNPKYNAYEKIIYQCQLMFANEDDYLPLEWIRPTEYGEFLLSNVEYELIYRNQPELNKHGKGVNQNTLGLYPLFEDHISGRCINIADGYIQEHHSSLPGNYTI